MIFEMNVFFLSRYIVKLDYIESTVKDYFFVLLIQELKLILILI